MTFKEAPSHQALLTKLAEVTASQTANGVQHPTTIALGKEAGVLTKKCGSEAKLF